MNQRSQRWPDSHAWLFSVKIFAAAMLAVYVSLRIGLPRPYWAMSTCYIVAQPWSGMARAKGIYRIFGTLAGAAVAVAMVPLLVDAPPLLAAAMALWVGLCLAASLLIPAPQNYAFLLAGYTAAIVGFPVVDAPGTIFDTAVARALEINTGIMCVLLVESIFPMHAGPRVLAQLDRTLASLVALTKDVLRGGLPEAALRRERFHAARDNAALAVQIVHLRYEPPSGLNLRAWVPVLHARMRRVPLLLASIVDRTAALHAEDPAALAALTPLLNKVSAWLQLSETDPSACLADADTILQAVATAAERGTDTHWRGLLRLGLLARLQSLVTAWRDSLQARLAIGTQRLPGPADRVAAAGWPPAHADPMVILSASAAAVLAVLAVSAFWIATAWPDGATAATWAAIGAALFAQQDDPRAAVGRFLVGAVVAVVMVGIYQFGVMPAITTGFVPLALALAVLFIPAGAAQGTPGLFAWALPMTMTGASALALSSHFAIDFPAFANSSLAILAGLFAAQSALAITRPAGLAWRLHRLAQANRAALVRATRTGTAPDETLPLMLDQFDEVAARLPAQAGPKDTMLVGLRLALSVMELRTIRTRLAPRLALRVDRVLRHVSRHVAHHDVAANHADEALRAALDTALAAAVAQANRPAALALAGMRRAILPLAPPPLLAPPALNQPPPVPDPEHQHLTPANLANAA